MQTSLPRLCKSLLIVLVTCITLQAAAQTPAMPGVGGKLYVCYNSNSVLTASGVAGASFAWYDAASGGNLLSSSATYTTPALTNNTHYYVQQTANGSTSTRNDVYVLVASNPTLSSPASLLASPAVICQGFSSNLSATVDATANQYVYWYDSATGGSLLGSSASGGNFTVSPMTTKTYYAQSQAQIINQTFNFTGGVQTFTVPAGVTSITIDARGGRGGYDYECCGTIQGQPGNGGRVQATMSVTPGQVLSIYVGQRGYGYNGTYNSTTAYNGGGMHYGGDINAGGGGGATDIRINGQALTNRVLVAGGGGGSGTVSQSGGAGGGLTGGNGDWDHNSGYNQTNSGGKGGSQVAGGAGGNDQGGQNAPAGSLGNGGTSGQGWVSSAASGGAGGGGYYGGGGGEDYAGGGGGSSYTDAALFQNVVHTQGYNNTDGQLVITYNSSANCAAQTRQPVTVTVNTTPTVSAGSNVITCTGTAATLTATGADTYTWTPGNLTGASVSVNPASTTTYTVTGKLTNGGCTNTSNVTVTVTSVSASASTAICLNQSTNLSASGADSYTWQPGNLTGQSVNVSPTNTTTYTVTGHNNVGCSTTAQTTITVNPLPPVSIGSAQSVRAGTSVTLTATGADNYSWAVPYSANTAAITFKPAATATWTATGYYASTGCSTTATAVITVLPIPAISGNTQVCPGSTTTLTASGGSGAYKWYPSLTSNTALFSGAAFVTPAINADTAFYLSDNGGPRVPVNIFVTIPNIQATASPAAICIGSGATLSVNPATTVYWYDALNGGNLLDSTASLAVIPQSTKVYYAQVQTQAITQTFNVTGGVQTFTVPAGVTSITIDARGGRGGYDYEAFGVIQGQPGNGGRVQATMNVTPGQVLSIYVGERGYGYNGTYNSTTAYNGGGMHFGGDIDAGGGGGATDIRINGQALTNRVLVAGGGGGSGRVNPGGGAGGGLTAGNGDWDHNSGYNQTNSGGKGGSQVAGGAGGNDQGGQNAPVGSLGNGGTSGLGWVSSAASGGAGGGGYYGGGGGEDYAGGGGGSSYTDAVLFQNVLHTQGYNNTDGQLIITYNATCTVRIPDTVKVNQLPAVKANASTNPVTFGNTETLTGSGAKTYTWNNSVQDGVAFTPSAPSTYIVTGTDSFGCVSTDTLNLQMVYKPVITSFTPTTAGKGLTVTITGQHFTGATAVSFGGVAATSFHVVSDSVITAIVSTGAAGSVAVQTPAGSGSLAGFSFCTSVSPAVSITASAGNLVCYGTKVIFTAKQTSAGAGALYQWYKNNIKVGISSTTYTDSLLRDKDSIWVAMTSFANCAVSNNVVSNKVIIAKGTNTLFAYIATGGGKKVSVVNIGNGTNIANIPIGNGAAATSVTPDGKKVYATNWQDNTVNVISTATNTVIKTIGGFSGPQGVVVSPDGKKAYVANSQTNSGSLFTVQVIDVNADTLLPAVAVSGVTASWISTSPDGQKLYVGSEAFSQVSVINAASNSVIGSIHVSNPWGMTLSPDGSKLYAADYGGNALSVINTATNAVTASIPVGPSPVGVAISPDGSKVYVSSTAANNVKVISTATNAVMATIPVPGSPYGLNITPDGSTLITANDGASTASFINTTTNTLTNSVSIASAPLGFGNFIANIPSACLIQTPSATVTANVASPICTATKVTFTVTAANAGVPVTYQWYKNNTTVGTGAKTYVDSLLNNNDSVWCVVTSSADNLSSPTAKSNVMMYTVNPKLAPTLTIAANTATTICAGTKVTFTATATNAGANPTYQWVKNTTNVGTNSATYKDSTLATGDSVYCILTVTAPCASPTTRTSSKIKFTVNPIVTPSVTVTANYASPICAATKVTFTATAVNGGTVIYQWYKNNTTVGTNSNKYADSLLNSGDSIWCVVTSSVVCVTNNTAKSNVMKYIVNPKLAPSITIKANVASPICAGTSVIFTATATSAGANRTYQWKKNAVNVGTNSTTYTDASLVTGDSIQCLVTATAPCASPVSRISSSIKFTVNPIVTPSVSVTANYASPICAATKVTFTATAVNGGTVIYQWYKNNVTVGTNAKTYADSLLNSGDSIWCVVTSSVVCVTTNTAKSNVMKYIVNPKLAPSITIKANVTSPICAGTSVTFTATATSAGANPTYQWKKNTVNVGTNSVTYTDASLVTGDSIYCVLTATAPCASPVSRTSSSIKFTVNPIVTPSVTVTANYASPICAATKVTFTATAVNGGTVTYQWYKNNATVGTNSKTYADSLLNSGDSIWCVIANPAACVTIHAAMSNILKYTVNPKLSPVLTIQASTATTICAGTSVTFTAMATSAGANPTYQWVKNTTNVGTNSTTYTDNTLATGDSVYCILTINAPCSAAPSRTSSKIKFTVQNVAAAQPGNITGLKTVTANQAGITYQVANASGTTFNWVFPAGVIITSGQGTSKVIVNWGNTAGTISVTATNACGTSPARLLSVSVTAGLAATGYNPKMYPVDKDYLSAYPNPVVSTATVAFGASAEYKYEAQVMTSLGQLVMSKSGRTIKGINTVSFDMERLASAIYYVRLVDKEHGTRIITFLKAK